MTVEITSMAKYTYIHTLRSKKKFPLELPFFLLNFWNNQSYIRKGYCPNDIYNPVKFSIKSGFIPISTSRKQIYFRLLPVIGYLPGYLVLSMSAVYFFVVPVKSI